MERAGRLGIPAGRRERQLLVSLRLAISAALGAAATTGCSGSESWEVVSISSAI